MIITPIFLVEVDNIILIFKNKQCHVFYLHQFSKTEERKDEESERRENETEERTGHGR